MLQQDLRRKKMLRVRTDCRIESLIVESRRPNQRVPPWSSQRARKCVDCLMYGSAIHKENSDDGTDNFGRIMLSNGQPAQYGTSATKNSPSQITRLSSAPLLVVREAA